MISVIKEKEEVYGRSVIQIEEIEIKENSTLVNVYGNLIDLKPLPVSIPNADVHCYAFIERFIDYGIITVDLIYGSMDLYKMQVNEAYRNEILSQFDRESLEKITRERLGAMFQTPDMNYSSQTLQKAVMVAWGIARNEGTAYGAETINKTKIKNSFNKSTVKSDEPKENIFKKAVNFYSSFFTVMPNQEELGSNEENSKYESDEEILSYGNIFSLIKSGATIVNGVVCTKFTFVKRDFRIAGQEKNYNDATGTFLVSGMKDSQIKHNQEYRERFLECLKKNNVINILLDEREKRGVFLSYAGDFKSTSTYLEARPEITDELDEVSKLNLKYYGDSKSKGL